MFCIKMILSKYYKNYLSSASPTNTFCVLQTQQHCSTWLLAIAIPIIQDSRGILVSRGYTILSIRGLAKSLLVSYIVICWSLDLLIQAQVLVGKTFPLSQGNSSGGGPRPPVRSRVNRSHKVMFPLTHTFTGTSVKGKRCILHLIQTVTAVEPTDKKERNISDSPAVATNLLVNQV